jgi:hypothetical protein
LNTPMVPGPHTSWVMSTSAWTHTLSPASTRDLPDARAKIFSVNVIQSEVGTYPMKDRGATTGFGVFDAVTIWCAVALKHYAESKFLPASVNEINELMGMA